MTSHDSQAGSTRQRAEAAARQASTNPWVERLGRFGFAAKGVVYAIVGLLAAGTALGLGGTTTDTRGALLTIQDQPFGRILLALVALGLVGYALWRVVQAAADTENKGADAKGAAARIGYAISGLLYVGLALTAARLVIGSESGGSNQQDLTARVLEQPSGRWLVGLVGLIIVGVGGYQLYKAYTAKFREKLRLGEMSQTEETWATRFGQFGTAAHGLVLAIIGGFVVQAALQYDPSKAQGLGGALATLAAQPFGAFLLALVAAGLVAYGIYMLVEARYRRMILR